MEIEMRPDELYHYGRLGMKWGKHIFGRDKSVSKRNGKSARVKTTGKKRQLESKPEAPKRKSVKDMTDDELRKETSRFSLESDYIRARNKLDEAMNPQTQGNGKYQQQENKRGLAKEVFQDTIKPAVLKVGREQLEKYLKTELGKLLKPKPTEMDLLKKEQEVLSLKSKIATSKKVVYQTNKFFDEEREAREKKAAEKAQEKEAQKLVDDYIKKGREADSVTSSTYSKLGDDISDRITQTRKPQYLPAVIQPAVFKGLEYAEKTLNEKGNKPVKTNPKLEFEGETVAKQILDKHGKVLLNVKTKSSNVNTGEKATRQILDKYGRTMVYLDGKTKEWWE